MERERAALIAAMATLAGCQPGTHSLEPYRSDAARAAELEGRAAAACASQRGATDLPPEAFRTDGCSIWPDASWASCCVEHDLAYWCGGPRPLRQRADREFRRCVARDHGDLLAAAMYYGVRAGGGPALPFPWRWAYGWPWRDPQALAAAAQPSTEPRSAAPSAASFP